jgi:hypothetical protein
MYRSVTDSMGIEYDKKVWNLAAGVTWKFL